MKKVLIIEDDMILNSGLCYNLQCEGYLVTPKYNKASAMEILHKEVFDLIILDVNLSDGEGFGICKAVREKYNTPVIFLTARDLEEDVLRGFEAGADDYITKPFSIKILIQKVQAILRRCSVNDGNIYMDSNITIDLNKMIVNKKDTVFQLTATEVRLLKTFLANRSQVLTRKLLLEKLWDCDGNFVDEHTLTVNINRLRNKIESSDFKYIKTIYGMGYMWIGDK